MKLLPHFYELRPAESESDARVAIAIQRLSADPEYWKALAEAARTSAAVKQRMTPEGIARQTRNWGHRRKEA